MQPGFKEKKKFLHFTHSTYLDYVFKNTVGFLVYTQIPSCELWWGGVLKCVCGWRGGYFFHTIWGVDRQTQWRASTSVSWGIPLIPTQSFTQFLSLTCTNLQTQQIWSHHFKAPRDLNDKRANMFLHSQRSSLHTAQRGGFQCYITLWNQYCTHYGCMLSIRAYKYSYIHIFKNTWKRPSSHQKCLGQLEKRLSGFIFLVAKWLFFRPNTIIIAHGCRGYTTYAALAGGTEIKSEEMTVRIKAVLDKEADVTC